MSRCRNVDSELKRKKQLLIEQKKKLTLVEDKTNIDKEKMVTLTKVF